MTATAAAVGTFDGVHLGHIAVLGCLRDEAAARGLKPLAITFDRHPLALIAPGRAPSAITTLGRKEELIMKEGVKPVVMPFDEQLRSTTAADWMQMLADKLGTRCLVVGYDNTFGSDGVTLSIADYKEIGARIGMSVVEAPMIPGISSSAIRKAIAAGNVEGAAEMLGRHFSLPGVVVEGNKLGRTIGFPTANLLPEAGLVIPGTGVYAAIAILPDGSRRHAVVNVGVRPTVRRGNDLTIEAHIIGWSGNLYGMPLKIVFHNRLRGEIQFNSIDSLRRQIEKDAADAQLFLADASKQGK